MFALTCSPSRRSTPKTDCGGTTSAGHETRWALTTRGMMGTAKTSEAEQVAPSDAPAVCGNTAQQWPNPVALYVGPPISGLADERVAGGCGWRLSAQSCAPAMRAPFLTVCAPAHIYAHGAGNAPLAVGCHGPWGSHNRRLARARAPPRACRLALTCDAAAAACAPALRGEANAPRTTLRRPHRGERRELQCAHVFLFAGSG